MTSIRFLKLANTIKMSPAKSRDKYKTEKQSNSQKKPMISIKI